MRIFRTCLLLLLALRLPLMANAQQYTNLVLKGGGIRGIAYTGAIEVLEEKKVLAGITQVAGTSAGAILATLIGAGYTSQEISRLMFDLQLEAFNDGQWFFLGGQKRMRKNFGWYRGEAIEKWIGALLEQKTGNANITFGQLHALAIGNHTYKDIYITATNLSMQRAEVFSWRTYPDMAVKTAVKASTAIPLYYSAVVLDSAGHTIKKSKTATGQIFVDGGILENYPIEVFDSGGVANSHTLGLHLERPEQISHYQSSDGLAPYKIHNFGSYMAALYNIVIENLNRNVPIAQEKFRSIYISTSNINPKVRGISMEQKTLLYNNGRAAATAFFAKK